MLTVDLRTDQGHASQLLQAFNYLPNSLIRLNTSRYESPRLEELRLCSQGESRDLRGKTPQRGIVLTSPSDSYRRWQDTAGCSLRLSLLVRLQPKHLTSTGANTLPSTDYCQPPTARERSLTLR